MQFCLLGYRDIGEVWREELDIPNLRSTSADLMARVRPFYQMLHGVLRRVLWNRVHTLEPTFGKDQTMPAHLLGKFWILSILRNSPQFFMCI